MLGDYLEYKVSINGKECPLSHFAWECHNNQVLPKGALIDHVNGKRRNNDKNNLYYSNYQLNAKNHKVNKDNKSRVNGVRFI